MGDVHRSGNVMRQNLRGIAMAAVCPIVAIAMNDLEITGSVLRRQWPVVIDGNLANAVGVAADTGGKYRLYPFFDQGSIPLAWSGKQRREGAVSGIPNS